MQPSQTERKERTFTIFGICALVVLLTIVAAAVDAFVRGVTPDEIVRALFAGGAAVLFYPTTMLCLACFWMVLYLRLGRES